MRRGMVYMRHLNAKTGQGALLQIINHLSRLPTKVKSLRAAAILPGAVMSLAIGSMSHPVMQENLVLPQTGTDKPVGLRVHGRT